MHKSLDDFSVSYKLTQEFIAQQEAMREILYDFNHSRPREEALRQSLAKEILGRYQGTLIVPPFHCDVGKNIFLGRGGFINYGLVALDIAPITIGDFVMIGPNVQLLAASHPVALSERVLPYAMGDPITIGNNVWIGAGSIVMPGVTIGDNSVIGAGSLVLKDIPDSVIAFGRPCRVIKPIEHGSVPSDEDIEAMYVELGFSPLEG
ncbi:sugar O-acetyltransferase [Thaumasiovibrio sp. DFM-14]|uniref:sugar O-acetyltransferase n=1 Tax=Thaumasiovibrio sp. DFM-14 TaxID=3384792 RepID=UPI0039A2F3F4